MFTKFDHNLVMAGIPSSKVTFRRSPSCMSVSVILNICKFIFFQIVLSLTKEFFGTDFTDNYEY
ncbi:hypothetical protein GXM_01221 [Nostoc sphaeroides CCNUC1]|uniref:Uncharacterized protein n=1 Tax=Nostoc sphaeroides CCNUC1 TaxID=2653204 RepID=A0A5P8VTH1_9NOSO|nr:hypothetical protein GXM_01221 [Nostoc sphaeroides CCNUC1]